jgi:hypothetical protein
LVLPVIQQLQTKPQKTQTTQRVTTNPQIRGKALRRFHLRFLRSSAANHHPAIAVLGLNSKAKSTSTTNAPADGTSQMDPQITQISQITSSTLLIAASGSHSVYLRNLCNLRTGNWTQQQDQVGRAERRAPARPVRLRMAPAR